MFWNRKDLPQPPVNTYRSTAEDLDLNKLRKAVQEGVKHFKDEQFLANEAAILSRILYRMKTKFRSGKDFQLIQKLNHALEIYFSTKLEHHLKNILDMTPKKYEKDTYLPTKNMLNYILIRLQGLVKLMERIYDTCLLLASELNKRISILVKYNTKYLCELYGKLLPHSYKLQNTGKNWLPEEYVLPSDLRTWLSVQWVYEEEFVDLTYEPTNEIMNFFNLIDDDDDDVLFCQEYILLDDEDKQIARDFNKLSPIKETLTRNRMRGFSINEDDIGEEITDIIELNDTTLAFGDTEQVSENAVNVLNKNNEMKDIGEEICSPTMNKTQRDDKPTKSHKDASNDRPTKNNKWNKVSSVENWRTPEIEDSVIFCDESSDSDDEHECNVINLADEALEIEENCINPVPDMYIKKQEIIVLDDTISNSFVSEEQSNGNKKSNKNSKKGKSLKKSNEGNLHRMGEDRTWKVIRKRKNEFCESLSNKKHKKEESLKLNQGAVARGNSNLQKNRKQKITEETNSDGSIIFVEQYQPDLTNKVKTINQILQGSSTTKGVVIHSPAKNKSVKKKYQEKKNKELGLLVVTERPSTSGAISNTPAKGKSKKKKKKHVESNKKGKFKKGSANKLQDHINNRVSVAVSNRNVLTGSPKIGKTSKISHSSKEKDWGVSHFFNKPSTLKTPKLQWKSLKKKQKKYSHKKGRNTNKRKQDK